MMHDGRASGTVRLVEGIFGFIRIGRYTMSYRCKDRQGVEQSFYAAPEDIFVSQELVQAHHLVEGQTVACTWRPPHGDERFRAATKILASSTIDDGGMA